MRHSLLTAFCSLVLLVSATSASGFRQEIETARKAGMQFLLDSQLADGSWEYAGHEIGITSLCSIALIENGVAIDDPAIEKAHRYVHNNYLDCKQTYDIALAILFLSRVGDRDNKDPIRDLAARLVAGQNDDGGWGYTCPLVRGAYLSGGGDRPDAPKGPGDNSCTQFATLGLWVSSRWGVNIDDPMAHVAYRFVRDQNKDGGWPYKYDVAMPQGSRNTMTFAGLFCLTVARANRIRALQAAEAEGRTPPRLPAIKPRTPQEPASTNPDPNVDPNVDPAARPVTPPKPVEEEPFTDPGEDVMKLTDDPVFSNGLELASRYGAQIGNGSSRYFLWSVERMGVILGMDKFNNTDWFDLGSQVLLRTQGDPAGEIEGTPGAWTPGGTGSALSDTSFAILFLRKANLGSDITRLLEGEPDQPFQITSQPDKPRFFRFDDALKASKPGDTIRIDSSRAIGFTHVDISHDLTIEAGLGYNPTI
ncbi:MAG: prenyltransferase/squalene oxidase repeat-containing protein, partial [Planctomycetaceae bacterium]